MVSTPLRGPIVIQLLAVRAFIEVLTAGFSSSRINQQWDKVLYSSTDSTMRSGNAVHKKATVCKALYGVHSGRMESAVRWGRPP